VIHAGEWQLTCTTVIHDDSNLVLEPEKLPQLAGRMFANRMFGGPAHVTLGHCDMKSSHKLVLTYPKHKVNVNTAHVQLGNLPRFCY